MSDNSLHKSIFDNLNLKETDELLQIWQENKRDEWSDTTFDIIEQILRERGVQIPPQDDPALKPEDGEDEETTEVTSSTGRQPVFYKPQELLLFADATSVAAWVVLAIYIINALRPFLFNLGEFAQNPGLMVSGILTFFGQAAAGVISFILLKGISFALKVLMEFEFNTRNVK